MPEAERKPPWGPGPIRGGERRGLCSGLAKGLCPLDPHLRPFCKRVLRIPKTFKTKKVKAIRYPMLR